MKRNYVQVLKSIIRSKRSEDRALVKAANEELLRLKEVAGQVHNNATLANMSVQYKNDAYIGLDLMPVVDVAKKSDDYFVYNKRDRLEGPDDLMTNRARPNEVSENRSTASYSLKDYALKNYVDNETLRNQDEPLDESVDLVEAINDVLALKREIRIASVLTTGANFAGNTAALAGVDQFDNASNVSIIAKLQEAVAALWTGAGPSDIIGYCSLDVWNAIARNAQIRGLFNYVQEGLATTEQVARYFGMSRIVVGAARRDTANDGQAASYSRIWGKVFGVLRVARNPSRRNASFGYTFRLTGDPSTDMWFDQGIGKSGGWYARVGFSEDYKIVAPDTGFLYTGAIA